MASLNKAMFIGNLTKDVEVRFMPNGEAVANFSIACNETWKDKQGVKQEKVEFINIVMYRKLAEIAGEYLKKGSLIYIEGKLQTRKWEKEGVTRYSTEIIADQMQMLGGKSGTNSEPLADNYNQDLRNPANKTATNPVANFDDFESDIPFSMAEL